MRFVRRRLGTHDEGGFTVTELICTMVLMGLVFAPLCMAVVLALRVPTTTTARSQQAAWRTLLINQWTLDADSAKMVNLWSDTSWPHATRRTLAPGGSSSSPCPTATAVPKTDEVVEFVWNDTSQSTDLNTSQGPSVSADYQLTYSNYDASVRRVDLIRNLRVSGTLKKSDTVLSGYCSSLDPYVLKEYDDNTGTDGHSAYWGSRREHAQFQLRDTPEDVAKVVDIEAAVRTSCKATHLPGDTPPPIAPGEC